ncbi:tRNA (adenine(58)-N(1))-methyltransferase non-catalytic subunit trm6 [Coemansia interrupta]|uniref:tRNA (adenine(58)-N(1))-methyltransferase non-catalytic subunit TRM6 n=1 Tax=Coemansia interrupta TaxID=1126814 RepID=A0A9W8LML7_9FUNG|nr:tRNA (adenine(58)-N(1))-methyltransferase non-catalytic subunit trm6 [Coemansia interrupta]
MDAEPAAAAAAVVAGPAQLERTVIKAGDHVIIRMPSSNTKIVCIRADSTVSLGKFGSFNANALIGRTFGHTFTIVQNGQIEPHHQAGFDAADITSANNQTIVDDPKSQKLSFEEIEGLKKQSLLGAVSSEEIISSLTENNEAFAQKTEFSKSKYIRRKQSKFNKSFVPLETTAYNLCEFFFEVNAQKTRGVRTDTLAQMLALANVYAGARVLCVDDGQGLVVGALLSRIAGGCVLGVHDGDVANYDVLRYINEPTEGRLRTLAWNKLNHQQPAFAEPELAADASENDVLGRARRLRGHQKLADTLAEVRQGNFDALVVSTKYAARKVVIRLLPYLGLSRMVVVYDQCREPLTEVYAWMRDSHAFVNVQLTEGWLREYQVLPSRTHPTMSTSGGGGFLLSAIYVGGGGV